MFKIYNNWFMVILNVFWITITFLFIIVDEDMLFRIDYMSGGS